jgi:hypothetical protein
MEIISYLLCLLLIINYQLAIAYIGVSIKFNNTILPAFLLVIIVYISKKIFQAPPILHTIVIVLACATLLYTFNKINPILSIIGSLLSMITFVVGSLLIACPFIIKIGFKIPNETTGLQWILLNLAEYFVPTAVLLILKIRKIAPLKSII